MISGMPPGEYYLHLMMRITRNAGVSMIQGKFGIKDITLHCTPKDKISYRQVFTIWVKNLWQTTQGANESDLEYAHRVWDPILGDKLGQSAAVTRTISRTSRLAQRTTSSSSSVSRKSTGRRRAAACPPNGR